MLTNTVRYVTLEKWPDGDITNGDGHPAGSTWEEVVNLLWEWQDDGRTIEVVRISYDEHGVPTSEMQTEAVAHALSRMAEIEEGGEPIPRDERRPLHPLVEAHTDFAWKLDPEEVAEAKADYDRDMRLSDG